MSVMDSATRSTRARPDPTRFGRRLARSFYARGTALVARDLAGPGKLARAFGLTTANTAMDLVTSPLTIREAPPIPPSRVARSARIGLRQHETANKPWRWHVIGSPGVSR